MLVLVLTETTVPVPSRDTWEMQIPGPPGARPGAAPVTAHREAAGALRQQGLGGPAAHPERPGRGSAR